MGFMSNGTMTCTLKDVKNIQGPEPDTSKHFLAWQKAEEPPTWCVGHHPVGRCPACPHEFTCVGPRGKRRPCAGLRLSTVDATARGPRSPSWDTATGTFPTWPPASSKVAAPRCPRTIVPATPRQQGTSSNPEGSLGGACRRPARIPRVATSECARVSPNAILARRAGG